MKGIVVAYVHRTELATQLRDRLIADGVSSEEIRIAMGDLDEGREDARVVITSPQTAIARGLKIDAGFVVVDEAHHYVSPEWIDPIQRHRADGAIVIGLSATPVRADDRPLGDLFEVLVAPTSIRELIERGVLVPFDYVAPAKRVQGIAEEEDAAVLRLAPGKRGLVFVGSRDRGREIAARLTAAGTPAEFVDGETPTDVREAALARLRAGTTRVLVNVAIFCEGTDLPFLEFVVLGRGCSSVGLYLQIVGRVLRSAPGKTRATIIDLAGACHLHGLPDDERTFSLEGKAVRVADKLTPIRQCLACGAVFRTADVCARCGADLPRRDVRPRLTRERLDQISAVTPTSKKVAVYEDLQRQARAKGYRAGWAAYRFRARYGHWPAGMGGEA